MPNQIDIYKTAERIAQDDPRLALFLLSKERVRKDYRMIFDFADGAEGKFVESTLDGKYTCDYFVYDIEYTVRQPNTFKGNILKPTYDAAFLQIPYMSIELKIEGCPNLTLTEGLEPLELAANPANVTKEVTRKEFPLLFNDNLQGRLQLDTDLTANIPLRVILVTHGYLLGCRRYNGLDPFVCIQRLKSEYNIHVNPDMVPKRVFEQE
jgi:hypothetical protein